MTCNEIGQILNFLYHCCGHLQVSKIGPMLIFHLNLLDNFEFRNLHIAAANETHRTVSDVVNLSSLFSQDVALFDSNLNQSKL